VTKPLSCSGCQLESHGFDFSEPEGLGKLGVLVCAEASGEAEARDKLPLRPYAPSGMIYERTIRRLGFDRDQFVTTNCVRCRPRENMLEGMWYEQQALAHCEPNLVAVLAKHKPRVLVALGNVALKSLTGWHGDKKTISHLRGYALRALPQFCAAAQNPDLCVVPTFHPAFLRRGAVHLMGVLARDIMRATRIASGKDKSFVLDEPEPAWVAKEIWDGMKPGDDWDEINESAKYHQEAYLANWLDRNHLNYNLKPTPRELDLFCRDVKARSDAWSVLSPDMQDASYLALSADLETRESANLDEDATDGYTDTIIEQIQFSIEPAQGIALAWTEDHQQAARFLLRLALPKVGQNFWLFDQKVLRAVGVRSHNDPCRYKVNGTVFDTLQQFHFLQPDLKAHLQSAASYCQFPFPWKHLNGSNLPLYGCVDSDSALRVYYMTRKTMEHQGIWRDPVPSRNSIGYLSQVQAVRPILADMEDRGIPVDNARRLALDSDFEKAQTELMIELNERFPDEIRSVHPKEGYKKVPKDCSNLVKRTFTDKEGNSVERWCRLEEFLPNSSKQMLRYMKLKGHKVPKTKHGEDTTGKKEMEKLAVKQHDNFYLKVIECREMSKMRGTYIEGYKPHSDGRVHTTFTFATGTGQLSSRNPNVQNYPAHGALGKAVKSMIAAPPGWEISNWDYKSFHILTLGFLAEDSTYMRMARLDMHSFVAWHFLRLPDADRLYQMPDEELMERFAWFKSDPARARVRDKQAKPSILGIGLGLMPNHLYEMNLEHFVSLKQAKDFRGLIEGLFPKVFRWQAAIAELAHNQTYLKSRFNMIRWFYEVKKPDGRGGMTMGEQHNQALALLVQNEAHGEMRERMKQMRREGVDVRDGLCNTIHDSFSFCYPIAQREQHIKDVGRILRRPSEILVHPVLAPKGLEIGVECTVGPNMADRVKV
jgi:uracil-DNA glycosylase family 4